MARKSRKTIRIELTEAQKKQIREQTGEEVETVDFTVDEVEQRVTPRKQRHLLLAPLHR